MKNFFETPKSFAIFKKLPTIYAIVTFTIACIVGIIDSIAWFTIIGYLVFEAAFCIWLIIGALGAFLSAFFTSVLIAPTVLRTEETLAISQKITELSKELQRINNKE